MSIILYNILFALTGLAISPFIVALVKRHSLEEKIYSKDFIRDVKFDWKYALVTPLLFIVLLYKFGICLDFFAYATLGVLLIISTGIDFRAQIIPNSINFIGFLIGVCLSFYRGLSDINVGLDGIFGMITGAGIFILIAGFSILVFKREGMGMGDVKLMGVIGLFVGFNNIVQVFVLSFFIGAIISIFLLVTKIKKASDYIPFGPNIVLATIITIFIPASVTLPYVIDFLTFNK